MVFQTPEYNRLTDRLDILAENAGVSAQAVALVNPEWDGGAYIRGAILPSAPIDFARDFTPIAQAAREARYTIANPREYLAQLPFSPRGQMRSDLTGLASQSDAAWWSAQARLLLPAGAVFGQPELGSQFLLGILTSSQGDAGQIEAIAREILAEDSVWYSVVGLNADMSKPLIARLIAELELLTGV